MSSVIGMHEVENESVWAHAWRRGPGGRHEMFGKLGIKARTFRDPNNPSLVGVLFEVSDITGFHAFLDSAEGRAAMEEDGVKVDTLRVVSEFKT